ncbi:MAG TPA: PD-(D/E)XK nuclease family protein [Candidatus Limnocylindrales bacterium]|nr:PD-(D/E)XK nuclease family protein [Candidatus Limnocylindrales bacterium]
MIDSLRQLIVSSGAAGRLSAARQWIGALPPDAEALIVAPHSHAADDLVQSEVARTGTRFGLHRFTLNRLAANLAAPELARRGAVVSTPLSLAAVVTRAIHRLLESGDAGRFAGICGRPGFPHAVARTFEELRGAGLSAEALRRRGLPEQDLAAIIERTERELTELHFADRAELFQLARAAIERGESPLGALPILLLDLPLEEKLEQDLVGALASAAPRVLAIAPGGDATTIARLEGILDTSAVRLEDEAPPCSLRSLQENLFEELGPEPRPEDDSVTLASWPGEARECIEIARLLQGKAAKGIPFDQMAVFLRSPSIYREHVEESLRRASVPAHFARGTTRPDPAGRATLALLSCAAEGLSARRFAEYLSLAQVPDAARSAEDSWAPPRHDLMPTSSTQLEINIGEEAEESKEPFNPESAVLEGTLRAPWRWERLLVDAAVIGGRDRWRRRLDGLAQEMALRRRALPENDSRASGLERVAADLEHLRGFVLPLIDRLAELPKDAPWSDWLEHLRDLIGAAIRHPTTVLNVLAELEPLGPVGPVDLVMVQHVLGPRLRDLTAPPETRPRGAVFVAPIEMARGLEFDVVIVPGLAEKLFPPRIVEDPLLPDEARKQLGASELATQESRVARERLALRIAVGAARRHLALSWPRIDVESARSRVPSFYVLEAVRAAEGRLPGFDELRRRAEAGGHSRLGWPAPERPEEAIDDSEYDLAVLAGLKDSDPATSGGAANYLLAANAHLARALRARGRRWLRRWTPADGFVEPDAEAMAALARHRMGARSFSPTALEHFSACPYRFFLQAVHRLQPREEAEALETIDPLTRGALFHEAQFGVLTALRDGGYLPLDPERLEVARELLDEVVNRVAAEYEERLAPAIPRVWADGVNAIRADLREWLSRAARGAKGWVPYRFELSFGLAERSRATADSASVPDAVTVLDGALLRGSIDLVERRSEGMLRVTDHKTGKARVPDGAVVWGGKALQPMLYALAAEALLKEPVESGRLYYCTADGDFTERVIPLDDVSRGHTRSALGVVARAIEEGFLPAAPDKGACRWCDYRRVCGPNEEYRTARKPGDKVTDLHKLRSLP